jgi:hypothetical protein
VGDILGVQDEQLAILRSLDSTVQRLADVPWGSARIHLEEAKLPGRSAEQVRRSLELASEKLHDAISVASANSTSKADARLMLAVVSGSFVMRPRLDTMLRSLTMKLV